MTALVGSRYRLSVLHSRREPPRNKAGVSSLCPQELSAQGSGQVGCLEGNSFPAPARHKHRSLCRVRSCFLAPSQPVLSVGTTGLTSFLPASPGLRRAPLE